MQLKHEPPVLEIELKPARPIPVVIETDPGNEKMFNYIKVANRKYSEWRMQRDLYQSLGQLDRRTLNDIGYDRHPRTRALFKIT